MGDAHLFLNALRTKDPAALERDALECPDDVESWWKLLAAASRIFSRDSCIHLAKRDLGGVRTLAAFTRYWPQVAECLPEAPDPRSAAGIFYRAQQAELSGNHTEALELYLQASVSHPLAAARAACLGGRAARLAGWRRYRGTRTPLTCALELQAICLDRLGIALIDDARTCLPIDLCCALTTMNCL